jgi:hypothetical protein
MNSSWGSTSPTCTFFSSQLQNRILCEAPIGLSSCTTLTLYGWNFINLFAFKAEPTDISTSCDNHLRDFSGLICKCAQMHPSFSSVSTVFLQCHVFIKHWPCGPALLNKFGHARFCRHRWIWVFANESFLALCLSSLLYACFNNKYSLISSVHHLFIMKKTFEMITQVQL